MLNEKIHNLMIRNYDLDMAIEKENELRNKCEQEKIRIANYCNDIKEKFKNVDGTIKNYEETIKSMKEENERLAEEYDLKIDDCAEFLPTHVEIPLRMHIGAPSEPIVSVGDEVKKGQLIAGIREGAMGANIHASISGKIISVTGERIIIERAG